MPKIPLNDPRYIGNLSVKSGDLNIISRNEGGNLIQDGNSVLYIETAKFIYDNTSINNVLQTNFEYYKFPSRIIVVEDIDLDTVPIEELNIEVDEDPIRIRYRLNPQSVPLVMTSDQVEEIVKNNGDTNHRFVKDGTWTFASRIEGSFKELEFGNVVEGQPQTLTNRFTVTQDILDKNSDLKFNIKVATRMTDNAGRNNYAVRLLKYNPDTNKYEILAQKTSESPLTAQYTLYIERKKAEELSNFQQKVNLVREKAYSELNSIVSTAIAFVRANSNEAKASDLKPDDLITMFNYVVKNSGTKKHYTYPRADFGKPNKYNYWNDTAYSDEAWLASASVTRLNAPQYIGLIIAAGIQLNSTNNAVIKRIQQLQDILINDYMYSRSELNQLINTNIHFIYSFVEMYWAVNDIVNTGSDRDESEFQELFRESEATLVDYWPGSSKAAGFDGIYLKDVKYDGSAIDFRDNKLIIGTCTSAFKAITNDNYKTFTNNYIIQIFMAVSALDRYVRACRDAIIKKWDETDRNFIPRNELVDPAVYEANLEKAVVNAAAAIAVAEKTWIGYVKESATMYNKLLGTSFSTTPTTYDEATTLIISIVRDPGVGFNNLSETDKNSLRRQLNRTRLDAIRGQRDKEQVKYDDALFKLKSYQNRTVKSLVLTDVLSDGKTDNVNARSGYLWPADLPYVVSINEIIPASSLKLHDSYAVEFVATPHAAVPHEFIEDQSYWEISELQEDTSTPKRSGVTVTRDNRNAPAGRPRSTAPINSTTPTIVSNKFSSTAAEASTGTGANGTKTN